MQGGQGTAGKLLKDPALYDEMQKVARARSASLLADLNAGKGTAGKLLKDEQLHQRFDQLVAKLNTTVDKINAGQGTLGQFMVNPQLYETLTGATREFQSLAKDMRANPKKFLTHQADVVLKSRANNWSSMPTISASRPMSTKGSSRRIATAS